MLWTLVWSSVGHWSDSCVKSRPKFKLSPLFQIHGCWLWPKTINAMGQKIFLSLGDFIQPKNCEISNSGGNIFCLIRAGSRVVTGGFNGKLEIWVLFHSRSRSYLPSKRMNFRKSLKWGRSCLGHFWSKTLLLHIFLYILKLDFTTNEVFQMVFFIKLVIVQLYSFCLCRFLYHCIYLVTS